MSIGYRRVNEALESQFPTRKAPTLWAKAKRNVLKHEMFTNRKPTHDFVINSQYKVLLHLPPFSR